MNGPGVLIKPSLPAVSFSADEALPALAVAELVLALGVEPEEANGLLSNMDTRIGCKGVR